MPASFKIGDKVVYPNHGVGVIEQVTNKSIGETVASFYCLRILATDSTVMVPIGNTLAVGLRKVLTKRLGDVWCQCAEWECDTRCVGSCGCWTTIYR